MANIDKDGSPNPTSDQSECQESYHPNKMVYFDDNNLKHEIHIPARDYYKANLHMQKKEWSELNKFPKWNNQVYTKADNLNNIIDVKQFYSVPPNAMDTEEWSAKENKMVNIEADSSNKEKK